MSEQATKSDIRRVEKKIDGAVNELAQIISDFASSVDQRFTVIEDKLREQDLKYDKLINTTMGLLAE